MVENITGLIFGYKLTNEIVEKLKDIDEERYISLLDDDFLHSLSNYECSDTILGIFVINVDTYMPAIYSIEDINNKLIDIKDDKKKRLFEEYRFLREKKIINNSVSPQLYLMNMLI